MIYELRRYTLRPGRRETLLSLFEREFVETQEAAGIDVTGQFRDLDDPDAFPWMRAFPGMEERKAALTAFYTGPAWRAHRDAANATMIDSTDVLLLRPAGGGLPRWERPPIGAGEVPSSLYVATIYQVGPGFEPFFAEEVAPVLRAGGTPPLACFATEHAENTFPALPVRTGEEVFVWFTRFDRVADERVVDVPALGGRLTAPVRRLRLAPSARSALR
ncbi:NIPSNAP family protein [Nonomuraea sp. SBT364]|uniref:NIPSNAP family protein n=1 Tax=Nonomuraea sp. SBT364 TaxID=1580530 RepID=UPI00066DD2AB|nr:NIPSNAP family protein [Nonomuraea sp. SBT364]